MRDRCQLSIKIMKKTLICLILTFLLLLCACGPYRVTIELDPNGSGSGSLPPIIPPVTLPPVTTPGTVYTTLTPTVPEITIPPDAPSIPELEAALSDEITTDDGFVLALNESGTYTLVGIVGNDRDTLELPDEHEGIPVTRILDGVFYDHGEIINLTLPDRLEEIPSNLFTSCNKLTYTDINGGRYLGSRQNPHKYLITVTSDGITRLSVHRDCSLIASGAAYNHSNITNVIINSKDPIIICSSAFFNCDRLRSVNIVASVDSVGKYAFSGCILLSYFNCTEGIRTIERQGFASCRSLTSFNFRNTEYIAQNAFYNCVGLKSVVLPESVKFIGAEAFKGATALKEVVLSEGIETIFTNSFPVNAPFADYNSCKYLGNAENPYMYLMSNYGLSDTAPSLVVHKNTYGIAKNLIGGSYDLNTVAVGENGTGKYLVSEGNCVYERESGKLVLGSSQSVIPDAVTSIGSEAFAYAHSLEAIAIPNTVTIIYESAFINCNSLINVTFEDRQTPIEIGDYAFAYCENLVRLVLGDIPVTIGEYAFSNCISMSTAIIQNAASIGSYAFAYSGLSAFFGPDLLEYIPDGCFYICKKLVYVSMPSVKTVGEFAFAGCESLEAVPDMQKLEMIYPCAFTECYKLSEAILPDSLIAIGYSAFKTCLSLEKLALPETLLYLGDSAFMNCYELSEVKLPLCIDSILESTFDYCQKLVTVEIFPNITKIEENAFRQCQRLEQIVYHGSEREWREIEKEKDWLTQAHDITVICTDNYLAYEKNGDEVTMGLPDIKYYD